MMSVGATAMVDTVVVGAGAVGLAVARELARRGGETWVLEAESGIGQGVSSRNSEVIHAGLYYAPGSLKAGLCVRGKELLYALCASHHIPHQRCGKLVVATAVEQHQALDELARRAAANGVPLVELSAEAARALEPDLHCTRALLSPTTGIVDSHAFMLAMQADIEHAGGTVVLRSRLRQWWPGSAGGAVLLVDTPDGAVEIEARQVVNAAGLQACDLAARLPGLPAACAPVQHLAKGSYFALAGRSPFRRLIYPAPVDAWLGIHLTLDLGGQARFGPDFEWLDGSDPASVDYAVDPARGAGFVEAISRYWPGVVERELLPAYSGVRPKIHARGAAAPDFRIDGPAVHGMRGIVNLLGIESPGLTSALAIGEHVAGLLAGAAA